MATRFTTSFRNIENKLYVINITDSEYTGDPISYIAPPPGFTLNYETAGDDRLTTPVIASNCQIPIYIEAGNMSIRTEWDAFVVDLLASSDETQFQVYITEDSNPFWRGLVHVERLIIPDRMFQQITITASDGFGILESMPYDNAGTLYDGWSTLAEHVTNILGKLNLHTSGRMFAYVGKFQHQPMAALLPIGIRFHHDAFKEIKDDEILPFDCLTVLKQILTRFNLRIIQQGGIFHLQDISALAESSAVEVDYYLYTGAYDMFANVTLNTTVNVADKLAGGSKWYREQAKSATVQYSFKDALQGSNLFIGLVPKLTDVSLGDVPSGNNEVLGFGFDYGVKHVGDPGSLLWFYVRYIYRVRCGDYYLSNTGWNTDSASRYYLFSNYAIVDDSSPSFIDEIGFITPALPQSADVTFSWTFDRVKRDGAAVAARGTTTIAPVRNICQLIYGVGDPNEGTKVCVASAGNMSGEEIEPEVFAIGDKPFLRSVGRMQAYTGTEWVNTDQWWWLPGERPMDIDMLVAREIMSLQKRPVEMIHYVLRSDVNVAYKINGYIIMNASYNANMNHWTLDGFKPTVDRTGITYTDYVDSDKTGGLPSGVGVVPQPVSEQYWKRTGDVLSPENDGDDVVTSGKVLGFTAEFGDIDEAGGRMVIDTQGRMTLEGSAEYIKILPVKAFYPGTATFGAWVGGLKQWQFADSVTRDVFFNVEMPYEWKEGSYVYPEIRWTPLASAGSAVDCYWGLEYVWNNLGSTAVSTTTIKGTEHLPSENLVGYRHYNTMFTEIDGTGKTGGSIISGRLFRDGANERDTFTGGAGLLEMNFIIYCDKLGS